MSAGWTTTGGSTTSRDTHPTTAPIPTVAASDTTAPPATPSEGFDTTTAVVLDKAKPTRDRKQPTRKKKPAAGRSGSRAATFPVPRVGSTWTGGRRLSAAARITVLAVAGIVLAALAFLVGAKVALSGRGPAPAPGVTDKDVHNYHLTKFPVQAAGEFAARYMRFCWTYNAADNNNDAARTQHLATMSSGAADPQCGWNKTGKQTVTYAAPNGQITAASGYADGTAAYVGVTVITDTGLDLPVSVPIYAPTAGGLGMVVSGPIGVGAALPPAAAGIGQVPNPPQVYTDAGLAQSLGNQVLPGFFNAWGASDTTSLARYITPNATAATQAGLAGQLASPAIQSVSVAPDAAANSDGSYPTGTTAATVVTVQWSVPGGATLTLTYRLTMQLTDQGWFTSDIQPGDLTGGAYATPTTPTASTSAATPARPAPTAGAPTAPKPTPNPATSPASKPAANPQPTTGSTGAPKPHTTPPASKRTAATSPAGRATPHTNAPPASRTATTSKADTSARRTTR